MKKILAVIMVTLPLLLNDSPSVRGQTPDAAGRKFEVGGQFSGLNISTIETFALTFPCVSPFCLTFERSRGTEPGVGGRFGYNITDHLAVEAEINFFPRHKQTFDGGRKLQGLFGLRVGKRFEKFGVFGKLRPGFLNSSKGEVIPRGGLCFTLFPPTPSCFESASKRTTDFALDVGGVLEFYPSSRVIIRIDAGDTILFADQRTLISLSPAGTFDVIAPADVTHNFQGTAGVGFRF